jgi:hypothetical protein
MSILLLIFGVFIFFGLLMAALMAVAIWILAAGSFMAFIVGGYVTEMFVGHGSGHDGFLLGGAAGVLILWGTLAYLGNKADKEDKKK